MSREGRDQANDAAGEKHGADHDGHADGGGRRDEDGEEAKHEEDDPFCQIERPLVMNGVGEFIVELSLIESRVQGHGKSPPSKVCSPSTCAARTTINRPPGETASP